MELRKAIVIAIGSELISGQSQERNASFISRHVQDLGIPVVAHFVVDDDLSDILSILEYAAKRANVIFVTGGLGPTTDDITRDAIARFTKRPLAYDEASWKHIVDIFKRRIGTDPPETNRRQCFFPEGSTVLVNNAGTANAFLVRNPETDLWVLPGPPREIESVWETEVASRLGDYINDNDRDIIRSFRTIGRGESHIAEIVEPLVKGFPVQVAYRAHAPYIETKIKHHVQNTSAIQQLLLSLHASLAPWLFESDDEDVVSEFVDTVSGMADISIDDSATQGGIVDLISHRIRKNDEVVPISCVTSYDHVADPEGYTREALELPDDPSLHLVVAGFDPEWNYAVGMRIREQIKMQMFPSPYPSASMRERNMTAIAALSIKTWLTWLTENLPS